MVKRKYENKLLVGLGESQSVNHLLLTWAPQEFDCHERKPPTVLCAFGWAEGAVELPLNGDESHERMEKTQFIVGKR